MRVFRLCDVASVNNRLYFSVAGIDCRYVCAF